MLRALQLIVSAILLTRPQMPHAEAERYARVIQEEAVRRDFDPFTVVAIVHYESHWLPGVVSPDGEDYGLGQIRARFVAGCHDDADPVHAPSPGCRAAKATLFGGETNLRRVAMLITANRELCKDKVGSAWFPQWLAGYQGSNRPSRDEWCKPTDKAARVIAYQRALVSTFAPPPKKPADAKAVDPKTPRIVEVHEHEHEHERRHADIRDALPIAKREEAPSRKRAANIAPRAPRGGDPTRASEADTAK
ncbi:MAG TPA: hypothetical protein VGM56_20200 [Byssovorax sp.]